jgi:hypothetical protein
VAYSRRHVPAALSNCLPSTFWGQRRCNRLAAPLLPLPVPFALVVASWCTCTMLCGHTCAAYTIGASRS